MSSQLHVITLRAKHPSPSLPLLVVSGMAGESHWAVTVLLITWSSAASAAPVMLMSEVKLKAHESYSVMDEKRPIQICLWMA